MSQFLRSLEIYVFLRWRLTGWKPLVYSLWIGTKNITFKIVSIEDLNYGFSSRTRYSSDYLSATWTGRYLLLVSTHFQLEELECFWLVVLQAVTLQTHGVNAATKHTHTQRVRWEHFTGASAAQLYMCKLILMYSNNPSISMRLSFHIKGFHDYPFLCANLLQNLAFQKKKFLLFPYFIVGQNYPYLGI